MDPIKSAFFKLVVRCQTQSQFALHQWEVDRAIDHVIGARICRIRDTSMQVDFRLVQGRLLGNKSYRATHGTSAIQCTLWAAQHLDTFKIQHTGCHTLFHRRLIDVESGSTGAKNPADCDIASPGATITGGAKRQIGNPHRKIFEVQRTTSLEFGPGKCGNRHRYIL